MEWLNNHITEIFAYYTIIYSFIVITYWRIWEIESKQLKAKANRQDRLDNKPIGTTKPEKPYFHKWFKVFIIIISVIEILVVAKYVCMYCV